MATTIDMAALQKKGIERDLHQIIKVADESGRWFPAETYSRTTFTASLRNADLEIVSELYMLPGRYKVATIIYDSIQQLRTVLMKNVQIPEVKHDPLPELARNLVRVEFLPPRQDGKAQLGGGHAWLPVSTKHPVQIDLLFDVGNRWANDVVLAANVLSQLHPSQGCMYVSAVDVFRQELLFSRVQATDPGLEEREQRVLDRDLSTIDVARLNERNSARFFRDTIQSLLDEKSTCPGLSETPRRLVIVMTGGIEFPIRPKVPEVEISSRDVYVSYLRIGDFDFCDDEERALRPLSPHKDTAANPLSFRRELKSLVDRVGQLGD